MPFKAKTPEEKRDEQVTRYARAYGAAEAIFRMYDRGEVPRTVFNQQVKKWLAEYGEK